MGDDGSAATDGEPDFRSIFEAGPFLCALLDPDFTIVAASDSYLRSTMKKREDIVGRNIFDVFPDNPNEPSARGVRDVRSSFERVRRDRVVDFMPVQQYDIQNPDAEDGHFEQRYWSAINSPVIDEQGTFRYVLHRVEDVTEFVQLQKHNTERLEHNTALQERLERMQAEILSRSQELREANRWLVKLDQARSEFLSRMSHELRTPLNAVIGFAQLLRLDDNLTDSQVASVEDILRAGRHLLDLINEVLDIAKVESGRLRLSLEPVNVHDVVRSAVDLVGPTSQERGIAVATGRIDEQLHVRADRQRLLQVLLNLLSNAVKYNRPGGTIDVAVTTNDGRVRVSVRDTGRGIAPDDLERLFVPFDRLGAEQTETEGTGVGLALSRSLSEQMGGEVGVRSQPGVGSTFWVELSAVPEVFDQPLPAPSHLTDLPLGGTDIAIVYIEDNQPNLRLMERIMKTRGGVELFVASRGEEGLALVAEREPDLVLLDVHLPDIDGDEILARLRRDPRTANLPVAVVSADATAAQIRHMRAAGADHYLTKPLEVAELLALVDKVAGRVTL